jgi:hypothetical protein
MINIRKSRKVNKFSRFRLKFWKIFYLNEKKKKKK